MAGVVAPALRALLENLIDYAGMFPPASLVREAAIEKYRCYRGSSESWMLGRFVIQASQLDQIPQDLNWPFAALGDTDHPRAASIESKKVVSTPKPTYCEVPIEQLDQVKSAGSFAKIRTGGISADAIPSIENVAAYIVACAERRLPFKATAGLHHPIRSVHRLTYENNGAEAMMHGFINVFLAAAFAWHGKGEIRPILAETDPGAFLFDDRAHWRDESLSNVQVAEAHRFFAHCFGSCSFEEPVQDLRALVWL